MCDESGRKKLGWHDKISMHGFILKHNNLMKRLQYWNLNISNQFRKCTLFTFNWFLLNILWVVGGVVVAMCVTSHCVWWNQKLFARYKTLIYFDNFFYK